MGELSPHRVHRFALAFALALAAVAGPAAAGAAAFDLTGHWQGSAGNSLDVTQRGSAVTWIGHSGDGSWEHDFNGTLSGTAISGRFQDRPGHRVVQSGSISARVTGDCTITATGVAVDNGPSSAGGEVFTKTPCAAPVTVANYGFGFRVSLRRIGLSTGSHGSFTTRGQPNDLGTVVVTSVSARRFTISWRARGRRWSITFAFTGRGAYAPASHELDLDLAVKRSNVRGCRSRGRQNSRFETDGSYVGVSICGEEINFQAPEHASAWIRMA